MELKQLKNRIHIIAADGMICTNGEIYGTEIALAEGFTEKGFYEITREEYDKAIAQTEATDVLP